MKIILIFSILSTINCYFKISPDNNCKLAPRTTTTSITSTSSLSITTLTNLNELSNIITTTEVLVNNSIETNVASFSFGTSSTNTNLTELSTTISTTTSYTTPSTSSAADYTRNSMCLSQLGPCATYYTPCVFVKGVQFVFRI